MLVLMLVGQFAFIVASFALGAKLLSLWSHTRQPPELGIGLSNLLGGGVGYVCWLAIGILSLRGGSPALTHALVLVGFAGSCGGAVGMGIGAMRIFRPGVGWARALVGASTLAMLACWVELASEPIGGPALGFWWGLGAMTPIYAWSSAEALTLAAVLHKRARLGLAEPAVVHRTAQWGLSSACATGMTVISVASRWAYGPQLPMWVTSLTTGLGLLAAAAIWLGFFPPSSLRARLARAYAG